MSLSLSNKGAGGTTSDKTVGETLGPYEESMAFFEKKEIKVDKESVTFPNKLYVDGIESIVTSFGSVQVPLRQYLGSENEQTLADDYSGNESLGETLKNIMKAIIQLAKDAVEFVMNLINNKLTRLDNALFRLKGRRKRQGLADKEVSYPIGVRRLMIPGKVSTGPEWIPASLTEVKKFYQSYIKTYRDLTKLIYISPDHFSPEAHNEKINAIMRTDMGMNIAQSNSDGSDAYRCGPIPGNRYFCFDSRSDVKAERSSIYFTDTTMEVKLLSKTFMATGHVIDKTIDGIQELIDEVRKNQKTVGELHREFEKAVVGFEKREGRAVTADQRHFLRYLINHSKRQSQLTVQYVTSVCDIAMDFCDAGIRK
ncbi:hypothetical protein PQC07_gp184 [Aeromonas phage D3]|uniref:Uncharacterized protein n=1 Tax=Aeromonas phage D3 TaxID=2593327 RepID=A0A514TVP1_9CAUD|nr:hypothetical protein PQC07_gp184 [Aeromonas phage D3]QDJ97089.1 hypothetical protein D3_0091 [Aeromonas phage D3]